MVDGVKRQAIGSLPHLSGFVALATLHVVQTY